jgi:BirA family biotin operon repressor/biotin-[acetyl-CoA-carboxylase] ligase
MPQPGQPLDAERFAAERARLGLSLGAPACFVGETGSTNDDALAAARSGAAHGALFAAEQQSAGRGRRGRSWSSAAGSSLLFSVLLRPGAVTATLPALTLAVGLGVRAALAICSDRRLGLKWPNDVLCGDAKLAGILCEGQLTGDRIEAVVVGVGINVAGDGLPEPVRAGAVSLVDLRPEPPPPRERLLAQVLSEMEKRLEPCLAGDLSGLVHEFPAHDALIDRAVTVDGDAARTGIARGIDARGRLLLDVGGRLVPIQSGTLRLA